MCCSSPLVAGCPFQSTRTSSMSWWANATCQSALFHPVKSPGAVARYAARPRSRSGARGPRSPPAPTDPAGRVVEWAVVAGLGLANATVGAAAMYVGAEHLSTGVASVLANAQPLLIVLPAWALDAERPSKQTVAGLAIRFTGLVLWRCLAVADRAHCSSSAPLGPLRRGRSSLAASAPSMTCSREVGPSSSAERSSRCGRGSPKAPPTSAGTRAWWRCPGYWGCSAPRSCTSCGSKRPAAARCTAWPRGPSPSRCLGSSLL